MASNPRYKNGALRRKHRARLKAMGCECGICHGKYGPIDYDAPSDYRHPFSFVVDEIIPISRWKEFGYSSPRKAAEDWNNLQAAHYICNQKKGNKINFCLSQKYVDDKKEDKKSKELKNKEHKNVLINIIDGKW